MGPELVAEPDNYSVGEDGTLTVNATNGLLENDFDSSGAFEEEKFSNPAHGTLSVTGNGSFVYKPNAGFVGLDTFTYIDGDGTNTARATVTIDVFHTNPVANPDTYLAQAGQTLTVTAATGLLANDIAPDGTLEAENFSTPAHGTLSVTTDGSFVYTPKPGFVGKDTFTYTESDGVADASATVTIDVVDAPPIANNDVYVVHAGKTLSVDKAQGLLANDQDPEGSTSFEAANFSNPAHGTLAVTTDGSFVYTPNAGFVGDDTFTYTDSDGTLTASATATIHVVDNAPVASNDFYHTGVGAKLTVNAAQGLLKNDFDPDGDSIEAENFSNPAHGSLAVTTDGSFVYTPNAGFSGIDTFAYTIGDGTLTSSATASIVVGGVSRKAPGDFNGDGFSDILWQNVDGQAAIWEVDGTSPIAGGNKALTPNPGPSWKAIGTGDFNGDGDADILWQNTSTSQVSIWEMNGETRIGGGAVSTVPGPNWNAIGTGDFNADGDSDILFQNTGTGQVSIWEMSGNTLTGGGAVSAVPGPNWKAIGTGDFNGDGHSDILFQNTSTSQVSIWEMNGNTRTGGGAVSTVPGPNLKAIGTGDFNGDGLSDILFQNTSTSQVSIWEMNGNGRIGGGAVSPIPGPNWKAVGTEDFNGDGLSDILWQNDSGQASIWEMNGTDQIPGGSHLVAPNPMPNWHAVGV